MNNANETPVADKVREILTQYRKDWRDRASSVAPIDECLSLLDQQTAPYNPLQHNAVGENKASTAISEKQIQDILNAPLTELKAAVEGMRKLDCSTAMQQARSDGYNAALSAVADKIDEMIRKG